MTTRIEPLALSQRGSHEFTFDFNDGCRVNLPDAGRDWRVQLVDLDTACTIFDQTFKKGLVQSTKRYFIRFGIRVWSGDDLVLTHDLDLRDKEVLIRMHLGGIGDHLAWMGHVQAFQNLHGARMTCLIRADMKPLLQPMYPEILFMTPDDEPLVSFYATYTVLIFLQDKYCNHQPLDYRQVGLNLTASYILGLTPEERRPSVFVAEGGRPIKEKYVCIATHGSSFTKFWHNPHGWIALIAFLRRAGYRVLCVDRQKEMIRGPVSRGIPFGAEDFTGDFPLVERARLLKHAEFMVGLSSGLSWLAWAVGTPVVLISGFTDVFNEFSTPYRVINRHACHGCSNDVTAELDREDYFWCPRHKDTPREFECSKLISVDHVKAIIRKIPSFPRSVEHA